MLQMLHILQMLHVVSQSLSHSMTLCNPMDCSLSGFSVHRTLQARILEWAAFPPPGDLPDPGIKPRSPALQADSLPSELPGKTLKCYTQIYFPLCPLLFSHLIHRFIQLIHGKQRLPPWNLQLILVTLLL